MKNNDNKSKKFEINYSDVTINPIDNFYKKIINSCDEIIDLQFDEIKNKNNHLLNDQIELINNVENEKNKIENKKKEIGLTKIKIINWIIIFLCFLIIGLFFIPIYKKNRQKINEFKKIEKDGKIQIDKLSNQISKLTERYFYFFNYSKLIENIFDSWGIKYKNRCSEKLYNTFKKDSSFLSFQSCLEFRYKNTPLIICSTNNLVVEEVTTSNTMSFPYHENVTTTDMDGNLKTTSELRYETLTAYHIEPTPFIVSENKLITLTNFDPKLSFSTNNKKYLDFENNDFAKRFKINNSSNKIDTNLLQFFTIKAQEDYLSYSNEIKDSNLFFEKNIDAIITPFKELSILKLINNYRLFACDENQKIKTINDATNDIKTNLKEFIHEFARCSTFSLISPVINREYYNITKNYKIGNETFKDDDQELEIYSLEYLIDKLNDKHNFFFNNKIRKRSSWVSVNKVTKIKNNLFLFDCVLNSFSSKTLVENVVVNGFHVGIKSIPVTYERFYEINEDKKVYFYKKSNNMEFHLNKNTINSFHLLEMENSIKDMLLNFVKKYNGRVSIHSVNEGIIIIFNDMETFHNANISEIERIISRL